jgi:mRNA interferase MazF
MNNLKISRGSIWIIDLDPVLGHEQAKKRSCVVISDDIFNNSSRGLAVILPLTSKFKPVDWFLKIEPPEGGINIRSYIICDQPRTVSIQRFVSNKSIGSIKSDTFKEIEMRLRFLLHL